MATAKQTAAKTQDQIKEVVDQSVAQMQTFANEVPAMVREATEKAVAQSKETYENARKLAEENTAAVEASVSSMSTGVRELNLKSLNAAEQHALAGFDFMKKLFEAKSVTDVANLQSAFVKDRLEAVTGYTKDLQASAQKVANDVAAPLKATAEKAFKA